LAKSCNQPEQLCHLAMQLAIHVNGYSIFGQMSNKMSTSHKQPAGHALNQVHAIYMQSLDEKAMPQLADMAEMFANKYLKDGHLESSMQEDTTTDGEVKKVPPQFFVQLMFQILLQKFNKSKDPAKFEAALAYLTENKGAFKLILDYSRLRVQALMYFIHIIGPEEEAAKNTVKTIIKELIGVVKQNFENVKVEFYSILDMNELLISLVAQQVQ